MNINFRPIETSDFLLLQKWLEAPHVKAWWDQEIAYTLELVEKKFANHVHKTPLSNTVNKLIYAYIIYQDRIPIGYIQAYNAHAFAEENGLDMSSLPSSIVGCDFFIGEEAFLGKGLGAKIMEAFCQKILFPHYAACLVDPDVRNKTAINTYKKAGFEEVKNLSHKHIMWMMKFIKLESKKPLQEKEVGLIGGKVTHGIVRVNDTVRRPVGKHSEFVHALLKHLEVVDFEGAPRFLGLDGSGRETLSYLEGEVPSNLDEWSDRQLISAAQLIRKYHDATAGSLLAGTEEVVCHNDLSPCNTVLQFGLPVAFIDFDAAAPGSRVHDLAYAVWMWCCLGENIDPEKQGKKIRLFCDAYGLTNRKDFILEIMQRQKENIKSCQKNVEAGMLNWKAAVLWGTKCLEWVQQNRGILETCVGAGKDDC